MTNSAKRDALREAGNLLWRISADNKRQVEILEDTEKEIDKAIGSLNMALDNMWLAFEKESD